LGFENQGSDITLIKRNPFTLTMQIQYIACFVLLAPLVAANKLQTSGRTAPDQSTEVTKEMQQDLQIHDGFAAQAAQDAEIEKQVRASKELSAIQISSRTAPDQSVEVAREMQQNIQIHDGFAAQAEEDTQIEKQVEANRELQALQISHAATPLFHLTVDQQQHMHSGCVDACHSSQVESKCVTACEAAMYACIDHTGPAETPKDTDACQAKVLKQYKAKPKAFLQIRRNIDDDNAQATEMARMEDQADKIMSEDDDVDETSGSNGSERSTDEEDSFIQVKRNIDDDNAQAADMAHMEDQADNIMGEDNDETSASDSDEPGSEDKADSFIQVKRNIDDDNAQAAEMARMEDQADKIMGEDNDETSQNESEEQGGEDEADSFMQVIQAKRNIDDDNAQAAEMAHMEDQADKIMGEEDDDDDETSRSNGSERGSTDGEDSFIQVKRNIDDDNAQAAEMARMEDQADKTLSDDDSQIAEDSHSDEQSEEGE